MTDQASPANPPPQNEALTRSANGQRLASQAGPRREITKGLPQEDLDRQKFAKSMAHLCAMKKTVDFTPIQITVWYAGLKMFPDWILNRAVLMLGMTGERFPEFSDVYGFCREESIRCGLLTEPYTPTGRPEKQAVTHEEIARVGHALGLNLTRPKGNQ